ncbi:tetratricopeptide (TPR) repeat protein [Nakamurella sp. UYEF19]|uniref:CHAT domain-containing protein n=1 Tax=Nakamurella sp. UYEF19 TaxID=1756392 RepID=UPI003395CBF9
MDVRPDVTTADDPLSRARALFETVQGDPTASGLAGRAADVAAAARRQGSAEAEVLVWRALAYAEGAIYANDQAKALLDRAIRLARSQGLDRQLVAALLSRSGVTQELGRLDAAQRDLDQVRELAVDGERSEFHLQQAALFHNTGRLAGAAGMYRLALADPAASIQVKAMTANNLGSIEVLLGHPAEAIGHLELATALAEHCSPPIRAGVATTRSWVSMQAGRLTESLRQFDEAGRIYVEEGLPLGSHYLEYVDALVDLRLLPEAEELADRAVAELERSGVHLMAAEGRLRRARVALLRGDPRVAVDAAGVAAEQFARQQRIEWAAQAVTILVLAMVQLGETSPESLARVRRAAATFERLQLSARAVEAHLTAGRAAGALHREQVALQHYRRAQELTGPMSPVLVRLRGQVAGALANELVGRDPLVLRHCRSGLRDLARHRDAFTSLELRVLASGHGAELGRIGLSVLLRQGDAGRIFGWMELTRAAALIAVQPAVSLGIEDELSQLRAVQVEIAALEIEPPSGDATVPKRFAELSARQSAIEHRIRRTTWSGQAHPAGSTAGSGGSAVGSAGAGGTRGRAGGTPGSAGASGTRGRGGAGGTRGRGGADGQGGGAGGDVGETSGIGGIGPAVHAPGRREVSPASLRRQLDGRVLIEFDVLDGHLVAAVLEPRRTRIVRLAALAEVERHVDLLLFALRRLSQPGRSARGTAAARAGADAALLALEGLVFSGLALPDDLPVVVIPTGALQRVPWSALRRAPVSLAPSAAFWAATDRSPAPAGPVVLVAGPDLPGAAREVEILAGLHRNPLVLQPPHSTVETVSAALGGAGLAHLACHGRLRSDNPGFSALQLTDGSLTVHELDVRGIAPHRLVLASCNSAADISFEGNETLGFVSTLMARGTSGLVASIVVIPDASTVGLMHALHTRVVAGDRLSDALFAARASIDPLDPREFVSWCAFNTFGAA